MGRFAKSVSLIDHSHSDLVF